MLENKIKIEKVLKVILFIIIVGVFIFYISKNVINLIKQPTSSFILSNGDLYLEENVEGYIIRDEVVVQGKNYENGMLKIKNEGERVAKGEAIFRYYSENEKSIKDKIEDVENQIQDNMPSNEEIMSSDITSLDEQIKTEIDNIAKSSELQKIKEYKSEIQVYLDRKIQLIGESNNISDEIKNDFFNRKDLLGHAEFPKRDFKRIKPEFREVIDEFLSKFEGLDVINDNYKRNNYGGLSLIVGKTFTNNGQLDPRFKTYKSIAVIHRQGDQYIKVIVNNVKAGKDTIYYLINDETLLKVQSGFRWRNRG